MAVTQTSPAFLVNGNDSVSLSSMVSVSTAGSNPTYLILTALDRNEYTAAANGSTGKFLGNGNEQDLSGQVDDARGATIIFTYQSSSKRYYNSDFGYLDSLTYTAPDSANDVTDISLFATSSASVAKASSDKLTAYALSGTSGVMLAANATVVADAAVSHGSVPSAATPSSICQTAQSFVGETWNKEGCWVLASSIAAESGASLPPITAEVGVAGKPGGEWIVAFNGPGKQKGDWESALVPGEMVVFQDGSQSGHIATVVSGSGSSAQVIDNVVYENASGQIINAANDGSTSDVTIVAAHAASPEFIGILSSSVVVYELDTPIVTAVKAVTPVTLGTSATLSSLAHATDPGKKGISKYQVYDSLSSDSFVVGGVTHQANSADSAITVSSLASIKLAAGKTAGTDTLEVRAFNGTYWGDWTSIDISVQAASKPPVIAHAIPTQTWSQGQSVNFTLAGSTFSDPENQALTYAATLSNGTALPSWLSFDATTETFSGTVPTTAQTLSLSVTASDSGGLSVKDTFSVTIKATTPVVTGPVLAHQTANQVWTDGKFVSLQLPANTFSEPGASLTYTEKQIAGPDVSSWLHFDSQSNLLTGWVPAAATGTVKIEIIATDQAGHTATDIITAKIALSTLGVLH